MRRSTLTTNRGDKMLNTEEQIKQHIADARRAMEQAKVAFDRAAGAKFALERLLKQLREQKTDDD